MKTVAFVLAFQVLGPSLSAWADESTPPADALPLIGTALLGVDIESADRANRDPTRRASRLVPYNISSAAWTWTEHDEQALEVNYSFKYLLTRPDCSIESGDEKQACLSDWPTRRDWYFSYTGKFDFYMATRPSGPVINRISNPALHWRIHQPAWLRSLDFMDVALEHRSNGQVTEYDSKDSNGDSVADSRWRGGDYAYFDGISRGANYFSAEIHDVWEHNGGKYSYYAGGKLYVSDDSQVTWGPLRNAGRRIWDYDVMRLVVAHTSKVYPEHWIKEYEWNVEYTLGAKGLATDSVNASLYFPIVSRRRFYFPINFVKIHLGPMTELSNYTEPQNSISLGIKFNPLPLF